VARPTSVFLRALSEEEAVRLLQTVHTSKAFARRHRA
jgi:hypothetical protein